MKSVSMINRFNKDEIKVVSSQKELHDPIFPSLSEMGGINQDSYMAPVVICDKNGGFYIKIKEEWIEKNTSTFYNAYYVDRYAF